MLEARNLHKQYQMGDFLVDALKDVNFRAEDGEFVAIMGPSGSGKSTLLHMLGGLDRPTSGEIVLGDHVVTEMTDDDMAILRRQRIGFVFQFFNLLPTLTAAENVALPLLIDGQPIDETHINDLLGLVKLGNRIHHKPSQLSGGQQQRVALARALVTDPAIVLADEPTGNLDSESGRDVLELFRTISHAQGQTIVMVTHDARAASYSDRVVYLRDGQIVHELTDDNRTTQTIRAVMTEIESR